MSNPVGVMSGRAGLVVVLSADAVRIACAERGWSLSELARRARISRPTLAAALRGQPVRARTAYKLAYALDQKPSTQLSQLLGAEHVDAKSPSVVGRGQSLAPTQLGM
jgi:transcriptional regulator with XRE-family HTH domain